MKIAVGQTWCHSDTGHQYMVRSLTKGKVVRLRAIWLWLKTFGEDAPRVWVPGVVYERLGESYWREEKDFLRAFCYLPLRQ